jgi:uncharacterized protein YkwD
MYFHHSIIFGVLLIILQNCLAVPVEQRQNRPLPLTKADAKKEGLSDEEWDSPNEEWAEAREKNGGNRDIKSWPGSGITNRIITYPGTTNHDDIREGSKYARYMMEIHRKTRHFCSGNSKRLKWNDKLAKYASDYAKLLVKENGCGESKSFNGHDPKKDFGASLEGGENIGAEPGKGNFDKFESGRRAINIWAGEGFGQAKTGDKTEHYTALMWQGNEEIGCGWSHDTSSSCTLTVCNYISPEIPTNKEGEEKNQVLCTRPINLDEKLEPYYTDEKIWRPGVQIRDKKAVIAKAFNPSTPSADAFEKNGKLNNEDPVKTAHGNPADPNPPKMEYKGRLPKTFKEAMDQNYTWEDWNDPDEKWAKVREDLGGDKVNIETWPGTGNKTRIITYPGTTNEDIKASSAFAKNFLKYHNKMRRKCHPFLNKQMVWNEALAKYASDYAKLLAKENNCEMSHTFKKHDPYKDFGAGENLSGGKPPSPGPVLTKDKASRIAVNGWGGEGFDNKWRIHKTGDVTGHYTAMMWKGNLELGCGIGYDFETGCTMTACNYIAHNPQTNGGDMIKNVKCTHPINIPKEEGGDSTPFYTDAWYGTQEPHYKAANQYALVFTDWHNIMRDLCHPGTLKMIWNEDLAEYASDYAKKLVRKNNCQMSHTFEGHNPDKEIDAAGENIAKGACCSNPSSVTKTGTPPFDYLKTAMLGGVNGWGYEGYGKDKTGGVVGHYTAMMWFHNYEFGCGTAFDPYKACSMTVCNYRSKPHKTNSPKPIEKMEVKCTRPIKLNNHYTPFYPEKEKPDPDDPDPECPIKHPKDDALTGRGHDNSGDVSSEKEEECIKKNMKKKERKKKTECEPHIKCNS